MKLLLLNPPHANRVQRRYMCSYNAPNMLLPPQELIALGGILRDNSAVDVHLIDAIAEELNAEDLIQKMNMIKPDVVVSIHGFECFEEDMEVLDHIKKRFQTSKFILFGHYATLFASEILEKTHTDIIILGEPDLIFDHLIKALVENKNLEDVAGIAYKNEQEIVVNNGELRIAHPDELPMPAYEMLKSDKYFEPFLNAPFGLIQSARGCPYGCNYCVRSFGRKLTYRTSDQIIEEIIYLKEKFGIRSLRFIDDTFTANSKRVVEICKKIIDLKIEIEWTCLSRLDSLKPEMVKFMKDSGCKRIYFGVESGSPKVLKYLNKELDLNESLKILKLCKEAKIETLGFFIVGAPEEDDEAFEASVDFAIKADFDYIAVSELTLYPGTELYAQLKNDIDFSLFPYKNVWKSKEMIERNKLREKEFYRRFYFRKRYISKTAVRILRNPQEYIGNALKLSSYLLKSKKSKRADYL